MFEDTAKQYLPIAPKENFEKPSIFKLNRLFFPKSLILNSAANRQFPSKHMQIGKLQHGKGCMHGHKMISWREPSIFLPLLLMEIYLYMNVYSQSYCVKCPLMTVTTIHINGMYCSVFDPGSCIFMWVCTLALRLPACQAVLIMCSRIKFPSLDISG